MDHIGGLPNLLWTCRKLNLFVAPRLSGKRIDVHLPDLAVWEGMMQMLQRTQGNFELDFEFVPHLVADGLLYEQDGLWVVAQHNEHMGVRQRVRRGDHFPIGRRATAVLWFIPVM